MKDLNNYLISNDVKDNKLFCSIGKRDFSQMKLHSLNQEHINLNNQSTIFDSKWINSASKKNILSNKCIEAHIKIKKEELKSKSKSIENSYLSIFSKSVHDHFKEITKQVDSVSVLNKNASIKSTSQLMNESFIVNQNWFGNQKEYFKSDLIKKNSKWKYLADSFDTKTLQYTFSKKTLKSKIISLISSFKAERKSSYNTPDNAIKRRFRKKSANSKSFDEIHSNLTKQSLIKEGLVRNSKERCVLIDWLIQTIDQIGFSRQILFLSVKYIDCYLEKFGTWGVKFEILQKLGLCSLYLASRYISKEEKKCKKINKNNNFENFQNQNIINPHSMQPIPICQEKYSEPIFDMYNQNLCDRSVRSNEDHSPKIDFLLSECCSVKSNSNNQDHPRGLLREISSPERNILNTVNESNPFLLKKTKEAQILESNIQNRKTLTINDLVQLSGNKFTEIDLTLFIENMKIHLISKLGKYCLFFIIWIEEQSTCLELFELLTLFFEIEQRFYSIGLFVLEVSLMNVSLAYQPEILALSILSIMREMSPFYHKRDRLRELQFINSLNLLNKNIHYIKNNFLDYFESDFLACKIRHSICFREFYLNFQKMKNFDFESNEESHYEKFKKLRNQFNTEIDKIGISKDGLEIINNNFDQELKRIFC